jgi:hypothetical protein
VTQPVGPTAEDVTGTLAPLLSAADFTKYTSGDQNWYLAKVGSVIRDVCRWQVYPNVTVTNGLYRVQADGTIMLPSLYVTNVATVTAIELVSGTFGQVVLNPTTYQWSPNGYINIIQPTDLAETPQTQIDWTPPPVNQAYVTFSHGYSTLPDPILVVAMELLTRALDERTLPSNYTALSAGPFHASIAEPGMVLTEQQLRMLGPYTLHDM